MDAGPSTLNAPAPSYDEEFHVLQAQISRIYSERSQEAVALRTRNQDLMARVAELEAELVAIRTELRDSRSELKETQAMLGSAIVDAKRMAMSQDVFTGAASHTHIHIKTEDYTPTILKKRARSPSIEIIEIPLKKKEKIEEKSPSPRSAPLAIPVPQPRPVLAPQAQIPPSPSQVQLQIETSHDRRASEAEQTSLMPEKTVGQELSPSCTDPATGPRKETEQRNRDEDATSLEASNMVVEASNTFRPQAASISDEVQRNSSIQRKLPPPSSDVASKRPATKNAFILPSSITSQYLQSSTSLSIDPAPSTLEVPRAFLRLAYGGSDQHFLSYFPPDRSPSALEDNSGTRKRRCVVFPRPDMNPLMPFNPGEPGLVFASRHEILKDGPWTLFVKRGRPGAPAVWLYLGEYENVLAGTMSSDQFCAQGDPVKNTWGEQLLDQKQFDVYVAMRARIALRKAGYTIVHGQVLDSLGNIASDSNDIIEREMAAVKRSKGRPVNRKDIVDAFCRGDEAIDIIRMTCVKYDHVFANDMKAKFPNYDTMISESKAFKRRPTSRQGAAGIAARNAKGKEKAQVLDSVDDNKEVEDQLAGDQDSENQNTSSRSSRRLRKLPRRFSEGLEGGHDVPTCALPWSEEKSGDDFDPCIP